MPRPDEAGIRRYLLGLSPEPEAEALEEAYLADPGTFDRVRAVEDDLLDDYAGGQLPPGEKEAFEARYLSLPPLRERVVAARALRLKTSPAGAGSAGAAASARPGRWTGTLALAAGISLAVMGYWMWRSRAPEPATASAPPASVAGAETPIPAGAASPTPSPRPRVPPATQVVFALSPVLLRGEGGPAELRIPEDVDTVVLALGGDASAARGRQRLEVVIETVEGRRVWSGPARPSARIGAPPRVGSVAVPAERLAPGDYLVTLKAGGQTLYRYFLRVAGR